MNLAKDFKRFIKNSMRKEKEKELKNYIEELKTKKMELIDKNAKFLSIERYRSSLNNGQMIVREKLSKGKTCGSATIICPITSDNSTILVVQPRVFTETSVGISFPAGYVEEGEDYKVAALRELQEETGYTSNNLIEVASYYQDDGISEAFNKGFIAFDCQKVSEQNLDESEFIRYFECSIDELFELYEKGYILDGGTQLVIEKAKEYFKREKEVYV